MKLEYLLEKIVLIIYQSLEKYSDKEKIEILNKINNFYQIAYEDDDYGISFEILSLINYHIAYLYRKLNDIEKYSKYYSYYEEFRKNLLMQDKNYKHTSLMFRNNKIITSTKIIIQIKKYQDKFINTTTF